MATVRCRECGAVWSDEGSAKDFASYHFSTQNFKKGDFPSVSQIIVSGEALLSCPKDSMPRLDDAIQRAWNGPKSEARITGEPVRRH